MVVERVLSVRQACLTVCDLGDWGILLMLYRIFVIAGCFLEGLEYTAIAPVCCLHGCARGGGTGVVSLELARVVSVALSSLFLFGFFFRS